MKFPKIEYKYLGADTFAAEYNDDGAMTGRFGINPHIIVNLSKKQCFLDIPWYLLHEIFHFLIRPLPSWLEKLLDICWDVTLGKHNYELVWELYKIFDSNKCLCANCINSEMGK